MGLEDVLVCYTKVQQRLEKGCFWRKGGRHRKNEAPSVNTMILRGLNTHDEGRGGVIRPPFIKPPLAYGRGGSLHTEARLRPPF